MYFMLSIYSVSLVSNPEIFYNNLKEEYSSYYYLGITTTSMSDYGRHNPVANDPKILTSTPNYYFILVVSFSISLLKNYFC